MVRIVTLEVVVARQEAKNIAYKTVQHIGVGWGGVGGL